MKHKEEIIRLRNEGLSYSQIAEKLGCSKGTIAYHVGNGVKEKKQIKQKDKRNKIRKYLQDLKQKSGCADCKENYPYYVLEFDHRPGTDKLFNISQSDRLYSMPDILREVEKCDIVCSNCHKIRTWSRSVKSGSDVIDLSKIYVEG